MFPTTDKITKQKPAKQKVPAEIRVEPEQIMGKLEEGNYLAVSHMVHHLPRKDEASFKDLVLAKVESLLRAGELNDAMTLASAIFKFTEQELKRFEPLVIEGITKSLREEKLATAFKAKIMFKIGDEEFNKLLKRYVEDDTNLGLPERREDTEVKI